MNCQRGEWEHSNSLSQEDIHTRMTHIAMALVYDSKTIHCNSYNEKKLAMLLASINKVWIIRIRKNGSSVWQGISRKLCTFLRVPTSLLSSKVIFCLSNRIITPVSANQPWRLRVNSLQQTTINTTKHELYTYLLGKTTCIFLLWNIHCSYII